jgi:hypothetical protein
MQPGIDNSAPNAIFFHQRSDTGYLTHPYQITQYVKKLGMRTLDSGIDIAPGINVAQGTFGKNIKPSP